jgi:hypothetical protein
LNTIELCFMAQPATEPVKEETTFLLITN